ncbi:MAG TPA: chromosomal replication initiator DnaA [Xanthobacteraceae bacterium]|nr:chromosomal replication initiator DnaA [Xanthobacteraceae bacterium]
MSRSGVIARQLTFDLPHEESFRRDDFLESPANAEALGLVERWPEWPHRAAAIIGPHGSGKSHLASIWAERAGARTVSGHALDRADVPAHLATSALVVEDIAPGHIDEAALFHLFNFAREGDAYLLFTASQRIDGEGFMLPDLVSRLRSIPAVTLAPPDDALLSAVLVKLFADRQLSVGEGVIAYLLPRIERSLAGARGVVAELDNAALSRGRAVTKQLAADVLRQE